MSTSFAVGLLIVLALVAANLPFLTARWFGLVPAKATKSLLARLLELLCLYGVCAVVAVLLERSQGQVAPQTWEFYAITATLFVTFSFPGFVYCYLLKRGAR